MNLKLFFSPVDISEELPANSVGHSVQSSGNDNFDITKCDIALVGLTENRGASENKPENDGYWWVARP